MVELPLLAVTKVNSISIKMFPSCLSQLASCIVMPYSTHSGEEATIRHRRLVQYHSASSRQDIVITPWRISEILYPKVPHPSEKYSKNWSM